jgi:hypothetical protein
MGTYVHTYAINATAFFSTVLAIGDLRVNETLVGSTDVELCPFKELVVGDTLCALGFRSGGRRTVLAARIVNGCGYVLVKEGWYRWRKCYAHVI